MIVTNKFLLSNWFPNWPKLGMLEISPWQMVSSVESLPSKPVPEFDSRRDQKFLFISRDWVCSLPVFCSVLSLAVALILCLPHIQRGPSLCICLVFWSTVYCSPDRHLTNRHLSFISAGGSATEKERKTLETRVLYFAFPPKIYPGYGPDVQSSFHIIPF